jgi:phage protein U
MLAVQKTSSLISVAQMFYVKNLNSIKVYEALKYQLIYAWQHRCVASTFTASQYLAAGAISIIIFNIVLLVCPMPILQMNGLRRKNDTSGLCSWYHFGGYTA